MRVFTEPTGVEFMFADVHPTGGREFVHCKRPMLEFFLYSKMSLP